MVGENNNNNNGGRKYLKSKRFLYHILIIKSQKQQRGLRNYLGIAFLPSLICSEATSLSNFTYIQILRKAHENSKIKSFRLTLKITT